MADLEFDAAELARHIQITVRLRGMVILAWRIKLAKQIIRLAGWVAGVGAVRVVSEEIK